VGRMLPEGFEKGGGGRDEGKGAVLS